VEINNSFYRLPSEAAFDGWREQAPRGFIYALKASRYLTHMKKLTAPEEPLKLFFDRARRLRKTLGPVLYQLPPRWRVNLERFEHFLKALPAGVAHVIEFREASWLSEPVFRLMEQHGVGHCLHDMPPLEVPPRLTAETVYVRFHGGPGYSGHYSDQHLAGWASRLRAWAAEGRQVWVYFNNDVGGHALSNARTLKEMVFGNG
jgi:uncharacterized protein YecE (DUF72 family)